jgi:DNA uptake protein ComE-like DNA-binding protein
MKSTIFCTLALLALTGCTTESRSPDAIREDTARATQAATRDAKAVVQGVAEGLHSKGPVNINRASADDLQSLPGIDADAAQKIIAARPYNNSAELYKRRVISKAEYEHIADRVVAK